uniref:Uncharacterized protein n=1 Tax=Aegilops tauschii subsp. strangulata TaxID=200361 RepID=A0A453NE24_AEGTS
MSLTCLRFCQKFQRECCQHSGCTSRNPWLLCRNEELGIIFRTKLGEL